MMQACLKSFILIALAFLIMGCFGYPDLRSSNRSNLMHIEIGMSKEEVIDTMGTVGFREISNPMKRIVVPGQDGSLYEVLYYYTEFINYAVGAHWETGVTPVILKDNRVIGWGWHALEHAKQTYTLKMRKR